MITIKLDANQCELMMSAIHDATRWSRENADKERTRNYDKLQDIVFDAYMQGKTKKNVKVSD